MKLLLSFIIIASLCACASPTSVSYYQLTVPLPAEAASEPESIKKKQLQLLPVKVANYLNGAGLVMQQSEVELAISSRHLWADALDQQLFRLLTEQLHGRLPGVQLANGSNAGGIQLQLTIDRFHAQENGVAIVSGHYTLLSGSERVTYPFSYQQPLTADGYPALVEALSAGWQLLVADIITGIEQQDL